MEVGLRLVAHQSVELTTIELGVVENREVSVFQETRVLLSRPDLVALPDKPSGAWKNNLLSSKEVGCNDQLRSSSLLQCYLHSYVTLRFVGIRG